MSTPVLAAPPAGSPAPPDAPPRRTPWIAAVGTGVAVLLAGAPVSAVVQGLAWYGDAAVVVAVVVGVGLALHRLGAPTVAAGQCVAVLAVLTAMFTDNGVLGVLPGPGALREFGGLIRGAGVQIDSSTAPVAAMPEILFLVTAAFGIVAVAVYLAAVSADAPAAAGVPLLAVFAVPAALADDLLPWWALTAAAAGFGVLLIAHPFAHRGARQAPGGVVMVAAAIALALGIGAVSGFIGTAGRFSSGSGAGGAGGSIGLSPFTALRGELQQTTPVELFRVRGLPQPTYLRALTLRDYVADAGWQATRPAPGTPLPGAIRVEPGDGMRADVQIENRAFRDYWLPLYGRPADVAGLPQGLWFYDPRSGTGYTTRPREDGSWRQRALLPTPTATQLRDATGPNTAGPEYLVTTGIDARVSAMAAQVVQGRATAFDKALALQDYFTGPGSQFTYSLRTAPGGSDDALVEFLTVGRAGYCEQFASAMAVMLRSVGVPARVAVGFTGGTDAGEYRSITTSDAHAWVEAWFPGLGWTTFDPTPLTDGRAIVPPYVQEARAEAAAAAGPAGSDAIDQPASAAPTPEQTPPPQPTPDVTPAQPDRGAAPPLWPLALVAALAALALVPAGLRARQRRGRLAAVSAGGPDAAGAAWTELLAESADRGAPSPDTDTVRGAARRLVREHRLDTEAQGALRQVVTAVEASWFGGEQPRPEQLDAPVGAVRAGIAAGSPLSARGRLLPRSVLHAARRAGRSRAEHDDAAATRN